MNGCNQEQIAAVVVKSTLMLSNFQSNGSMRDIKWVLTAGKI